MKCQTLISGGVHCTFPWMALELLNGNSSLVSEKVPFSFSFEVFESVTFLFSGLKFLTCHNSRLMCSLLALCYGSFLPEKSHMLTCTMGLLLVFFNLSSHDSWENPYMGASFAL